MEVVTFESKDDDNTTTTENDSVSELTDTSETGKLVASSLLTLLDDKNRSICFLKRQVQNQKVQLSFYLHRIFNSPRITELAASCVPHETEDNIHVNLAMNQFCKQAGLKSRIMILHARMVDIETRIIRTLEQQEEMVRIVVTRVLQFRNSDGDGNAVQLCLNQLRKDCGQVEILAKVLGATNKLRKDLDTFRTCCNRLMVIEDERNSLVEQVYSMPVTQRMGYGVLLAAQYEKMRLEKEVLEIKQEQKILQERFECLSLAQETGENCALSKTDFPGEVNVTKMLEAVNTEAISLLETTKEQKDKYMEEIAKLRAINVELAKEAACTEEIAKEKKELESRLKLAALEFEKLRDFDQNQLNEFNVKLMNANQEREFLLDKLQHYSNIDEQVKCLRSQVEELDTVRGQRDYYKLQVDDLQAIRAAYAQLVEHCPARGDEGDSKERTVKILSLEKQNEEMSTKLGHVNDVVHDQEAQIRQLLTIIEKLGSHRDVQTPTKIKRTLYSVETTKNVCMMNSIDSRNAYSQTDISMFTYMDESQTPSGSLSLQGAEILSCQDKCTSTEALAECSKNENKTNSVVQTEEAPQSKQSRVSKLERSLIHASDSFVGTTSVEVQSVNHEGKSESLKAILKSTSSIDGVIEVNNSSAISLRLTCTPSGGQQPPKKTEEETEDGRLKIATSAMDEFELMKDSSNETIAATVPSVRQKVVAAMECVEYGCNDDRFASEDCFSSILRRSKENLVANISRETIPHGSTFDDYEDAEQNDIDEDDGDEEINEIDYEAIEESPKMKPEVSHKVSELTGQLQQITSNLDRTLCQPGGKDALVNAVKIMFNNLFAKE